MRRMSENRIDRLSGRETYENELYDGRHAEIQISQGSAGSTL